MTPQIILFDYDISAFGFKIRQYLTATSLPYMRVDLPLNPPRKELEELGITYGRVPILAIGKDVYCDSSLQLAALQELFPDNALPTTRRDDAYKAWGLELRNRTVAIVPPDAFPPEMITDRAKLFSALDRSSLIADLPNSLAEFKGYLTVLENDFLTDDQPYLEGAFFSMSDIHVAWAIIATLEVLSILKLSGLDIEEFPKTQSWIQRLPKPYPNTILASDAIQYITSAKHVAMDINVKQNDPLQLKSGDSVAIEMSDDLGRSGRLPQYGELQGLKDTEVVVKLSNGIAVHFPRIGVVIKKIE